MVIKDLESSNAAQPRFAKLMNLVRQKIFVTKYIPVSGIVYLNLSMKLWLTLSIFGNSYLVFCSINMLSNNCV